MYEERTGDPIRTMKIRLSCAAVGAFGLAYLVALLIYLTPGLFLLGSSNPLTEAIDMRHNRWFGTQYEIRVNGATFWCSGGDGQEERQRGARVVYDAQHPDRCRAQAVVGRLGIYEIVAALCSGTFVATGLAATVFWKNRQARVISFAVAGLFSLGYILAAFVIYKGSHG